MNNWIRNSWIAFFVKTKGIFSKKLFGGKAHVIMLHRVLPLEENDWEINRDLAISPSALEKWINYFISKDYEFWSLEQLHNNVFTSRKSNKRGIVFTLDDGYADNLKYALPIFEKYNIPICLFVTTCFIDKKSHFWWYSLEDYMRKNNEINFKYKDETYFFKWNENNRIEVFHMIRNLLRRMDQEDMVKMYQNSFDNELNTHLNDKCTLSIVKLQQMSKHPLVTIGGHTTNHLSLGFLKKQNIIDEIEKNIERLEKLIEQPILFFAYPYGALDDACDPNLLPDNIKLAFLNHPGNVSKSTHPNRIPRVGLSDTTTLERMREIENGIYHFSNNGFKNRI